MASQIDHLGIAVHRLDESEKRFALLLGTPSTGREAVPAEGVRVSLFEVGQSRFELLEPLGPESPIAKHLEKRGEGVHHVCLRVADIGSEIARLRAAGFDFVGAAPRQGVGGRRVAFVHPRSAGGILIELAECRSH